MSALAGTASNLQAVGDGDGEAMRVKKLLLEVQDSPSLEAGKCYEITPSGLRQSSRPIIDGRTVVGSDASACDIILSSDDTNIGKMHFVIEYTLGNDCFTIKDLGEGNGTYKQIDNTHSLHNGDVLSFGASHAGVQIESKGAGSTLTLRFFEGPRASEIFSFGSNDELVKIGRIADCSIVIEDANLSRYQCLIQYKPNTGWVVIDGDGSRRSANGTW
jgi:hypothetical protein